MDAGNQKVCFLLKIIRCTLIDFYMITLQLVLQVSTSKRYGKVDELNFQMISKNYGKPSSKWWYPLQSMISKKYGKVVEENLQMIPKKYGKIDEEKCLL